MVLRQVVIGSGPIRIGQGIEFDYGCVHAVKAIREAGMDAVLMNNNPETVSTDFDTSDRLYFEPLTLEYVTEVLMRENAHGILLQFGGQTAINLALPLEARLPVLNMDLEILGTSCDDDDDDDDEEAGGMSPRTRRLQRAERQRERAAYYARGSFYGRSTGMIMYDIAYKMNKDRLENYLPLWLGVVSMTDQYLHQRSSHETYTSCVMELASRVSTMANADASNTRSLEDGTIVQAFADRRLQYNEEFRFMLLRHWTLYESMLHSNYVATALQTWTERGRANLNSLFAHVGIPLNVAKQRYSHMSPAQRQQFEERLAEHGASHGLENSKFWSFQYSHGYALRVCAADVVYGATALLEGLLDREDEGKHEESCGISWSVRGNSKAFYIPMNTLRGYFDIL